MAKFQFMYTSMDQAIADKFAKFGTDDNKAFAFSCMKGGWEQKQYRKEQNTRKQILLEMAKKDPRFKQAVLDAEKKKSA
jgi:hypothetical protein